MFIEIKQLTYGRSKAGMPTISVCYARGKEYGLNKRLDVIFLILL
jgi:hypothetical protein